MVEKTYWSRKKVLVTGGGGFIGSHLVEALCQEGADVRALVRYNALGKWGWLDTSPVAQQIEVIAGDIVDAGCVREAVSGMDVVFHLAALIGIPYSYRAPHSYLRTNIEGTLNVLSASLEKQVARVVHTSTSEVYGSALQVPISEEHPLQGQSPYSATKIAADKLAEAFYCTYNLPVSTVRPFNTFGPRQSARAIIPTIITQLITQSTVKLGNLHPTRDFNYVKDTVRGFLCVAESSDTLGKVVNLGTGHEISMSQLARTIARLMGKELKLDVEQERLRPALSEVDRLCADNRRAMQWTQWRPQYDLDAGLQETIDWVSQHIDGYRSGVYTV